MNKLDLWQEVKECADADGLEVDIEELKKQNAQQKAEERSAQERIPKEEKPKVTTNAPLYHRRRYS